MSPDPMIAADKKESCRLCGGGRYRRLFSAPDFDGRGEVFELAECTDCGLVRTRPVLSDEQLGRWYEMEYYGGSERKFTGIFEALTRRSNQARARRLLSRHAGPTPPRVLDLGCGRAELLRALHSLGCTCHGVERAEFPVGPDQPGLTFHQGSLEEIGFPDGGFDQVVVWHVLEHLTRPARVLREIGRVTRPGGRLALAVPNFGSRQARMFKGGWFHLDLPRHTHHFTPQVMERLLGECGFSIESRNTFSWEQNLYGFVQSLINRLFPARPNAMYGLMKHRAGLADALRLAGWLTAAGIAAPAALAELAVSEATGRGASLIISAVKTGHP